MRVHADDVLVIHRQDGHIVIYLDEDNVWHMSLRDWRKLNDEVERKAT